MVGVVVVVGVAVVVGVVVGVAVVVAVAVAVGVVVLVGVAVVVGVVVGVAVAVAVAVGVAVGVAVVVAVAVAVAVGVAVGVAVAVGVVIAVYNIRGTNGSGKSTLARSFITGDPTVPPNRPGLEGSPTVVDLTWYSSPTKRDPDRVRAVEGYCSPGSDLDVLVVGSYRTACGGLDAVPDFATAFGAISGAIGMHKRHGTPGAEGAVIAEGVVSSTVWGSWGEYAAAVEDSGDARFAFCYLDTPVEVCLERIRHRQEAAGRVREIKENLVRDKVKAIAATREKALAAGALVYDLPWENAQNILKGIMLDGTWPRLDRKEPQQRFREFFRA